MKREEVLSRMGMRLPMHKQIRVYDYVDVRFILEDMYAKRSLCGEAEKEGNTASGIDPASPHKLPQTT